MNPVGIPFLILLAVAGGVLVLWLLVRLFRLLGWLLGQIACLAGHIVRFAGNEVTDAIRLVGGILTSILLLPPILWNVVFGRWAVAEHYGHAFESECAGLARSLYRIVIGNPARLLGLQGLTEGIESRLPEIVRRAPHAGSGQDPDRFEGYRVVGLLPGGGSGARLFLAEPTRDQLRRLSRSRVPLPRQVVIKSFSLEGGSTLSQIVRESRSLEAARRLGLVLDHRLEDDRYYYVMPFVPGKDLSVVTRQLHLDSGPGGLDDSHLAQALGYVGDLLETLERFHESGLWHKDIKPSNVIVSSGRAHLVDFGLVTPLRSAMTLTTHGTEYFRDPEMVRLALQGVKVHEVDGVKFDIYGAGAVLYSLLENSFPAHGSLSRVSRRCPEALRWIIRRAMADLPQRYGSAREMLVDLRRVQAAPDPFAVRPADLPSMQDREDVLASMTAAPAPPFPGSPWPQPPAPASSPFPTSSSTAGEAPFGPHPTRRHRRHGRRPRRRVGPGVLVAGLLFLVLGTFSLLGVGLVGARRIALRDRVREMQATVSAGTRPEWPEARAARAGVGAVEEGLGKILVLDDLPPSLGPEIREHVRELRSKLQELHWDVLGLGGEADEEEVIDLLATARRAAGLSDASDPEAAARLSRFLGEQDEDLRAILWLSREKGSRGALGRLVTRAGRRGPDPSLDPLREFLASLDGALR